MIKTSKNILSIIIPIYNVAEYLKQCLDSVYSQVRDDYQVILVDDGSTDNSGAICDEYKLKYPQTIVIHKENGGLSDARNAGIKVATGEYIYFVDSDDWLAPNAISTLLDYAIENKCDVVQGGLFYAYNDCLLYDNSKKTPFVLNRNQAMKELIKNDYIKNFAWGKIYKTEIVKKHLFIKGVYFEDSYWQHHIIHEVNNYVVIPTPLYYYRQRNESISGTFSIKILDLLKGYEQRLLFISDKYPQYTNLIAKKFWQIVANTLISIKSNNNDYITLNNYWIEINNKYTCIFKEAYNSSPIYLLGKKYTFILKLNNLILRVYNRILPNKYVTTKYE